MSKTIKNLMNIMREEDLKKTITQEKAGQITKLLGELSGETMVLQMADKFFREFDQMQKSLHESVKKADQAISYMNIELMNSNVEFLNTTFAENLQRMLRQQQKEIDKIRMIID